MSDTKEIREKFDDLFAQWEEAIQDPRVQISSRPQDYIDNEPYRAIVNLGQEALPYVMEKLEQGAFFLNQAVLDIAEISMDEILEEEQPFPSEQDKSELLLRWWRSREQK
jgi:hypothetical protein